MNEQTGASWRISAETRVLFTASDICFTTGRSKPANQIFGLEHHAALDRNASRLTFGPGAIGTASIAIGCGHRSTIENEVFALLIEHGETIQPQRTPE